MVAGTYLMREHESKIMNILDEIITHGFGEITIQVTETKNFKTKILIVAGKSWAYFLSKEIKMLDQKDIL